jgi:hypothetical protein
MRSNLVALPAAWPAIKVLNYSRVLSTSTGPLYPGVALINCTDLSTASRSELVTSSDLSQLKSKLH